MTLILDYAWERPDPLGIKAAGHSGVMRYISPDSTKNLTPGERDALHAAGLDIGLVWESTSGRAGQGSAAGAADARSAQSQANALGLPVDCPIFYAVDFDAQPAAVVPYFAGIAATKPTRPIGVYGSARVIEGVNVPWKWQASAWSAGRISGQAHLYQRQRATSAHPIPGTDENLSITPFPMWTGTPTAPREWDQMATQAEMQAALKALLTTDTDVLAILGRAPWLNTSGRSTTTRAAQLDQVQASVAVLVARDPAVTAAAIAAAIPLTLAQEVVDALASRLAA